MVKGIFFIFLILNNTKGESSIKISPIQSRRPEKKAEINKPFYFTNFDPNIPTHLPFLSVWGASFAQWPPLCEFSRATADSLELSRREHKWFVATEGVALEESKQPLLPTINHLSIVKETSSALPFYDFPWILDLTFVLNFVTSRCVSLRLGAVSNFLLSHSSSRACIKGKWWNCEEGGGRRERWLPAV